MFPTKTTFTIDWTTLPDVLTPGTYTASQLKALFNERDQELLDFLNSILAVLTSVTPGASGAENIATAPITGVAGATLFAQITDLKAQIQTIVSGSIPALSVTTAMIQDLAVTAAKLAPNSLTYANHDAATQSDLNGGLIYAYKNMGGF